MPTWCLAAQQVLEVHCTEQTGQDSSRLSQKDTDRGGDTTSRLGECSSSCPQEQTPAQKIQAFLQELPYFSATWKLKTCCRVMLSHKQGMFCWYAQHHLFSSCFQCAHVETWRCFCNPGSLHLHVVYQQQGICLSHQPCCLG